MSYLYVKYDKDIGFSNFERNLIPKILIIIMLFDSYLREWKRGHSQ